MAVEIPVVVDIDGAFQDAAKRLKANMHQIKNAIEGEQLDIFPGIGSSLQKLREAKRSIQEMVRELALSLQPKDENFFSGITDSLQRGIDALSRARITLNQGSGFEQYITDLSRANIELLQMREHYKVLEQESMRMSDSINGIRTRMADLSEKWNQMTSEERQSARGQAIVQEYIKEKRALQDVAQTLEEKAAKEEASAQASIEAIRKESEARKKEAEKIEQLRKKGVQSRQYENAILNANIKSMRVLQEQQRILESRLSQTAVGTKAYADLVLHLKRVKTEIQQAADSMNMLTGTMNTQSRALANLRSIASMYFSVFGLLRFAKQLRDITGELEYQRVALSHLIQDEEYGARLFEQIKAAAIESPFRIKDLVTYTKQLGAYRIEQENLYDVTQRLADVSAGLGVDMNRLILAYGQVRAASVLRGQELRQFTEAGIPLVELLADKMGELHNTTYKTADVFKLISERAVPFSAIADIFEDLTEKGGMFYQMQEEQAKTVKGRWEKLKDAYDIAIQTAGETKTFIWQNQLALDILTALAHNIRLVPKIIEAVGFAWATYSLWAKVATAANRDIAKTNIQVLTTEQLKQAGVSQGAIKMLGEARASKMLMKANAALAASNGFLTKSFAKLRLAMLTNPYAAVAAAVVGLVSTFVFWRKKTDETKSSLSELDDVIDTMAERTRTYERNNKLIDTYERLASKTERTTTENNKLYRTMSLLRDAFPELRDQINLENESLEKNAELLRGRNEALLKEDKQKAADKLMVARQDLLDIEEKIDAKRKEQSAAEDKAAKLIGKYKYEDLYRSQQRAYDKMNATAKEAEKEVMELEREREKVAKRIETLERYIDPASAKAFETAWQNTLARMKDVTVDGKTISLISDEDIRGYESIYKGLSKIDKLYKDSVESVKEMRASLSSVSEEYKEQALAEIRTEQARRDGYKAILDTFGYISSIDKKKGVSDLTLLKEELKTVQDIYKKYQEFEKYLGAPAAKKKIEEIYGNVTAIDFLSPDLFKKRISDILAELKKLQGRVVSGSAKVTAESFKNLKETIKKNEGFIEKAFTLKGEKYPTVGYGFYGTLPDGRKVYEGMKMTREEAERLLDLGIERRVQYVNKQIAKYGEGLVFNEEQMNVLLDLAWQSGSGVERVLKAAKGDANQIVEELKTAASEHLVTNDPKIKAGVKKRDMRRAQAFAKAMADATDDKDALSQAIGDAEKLVQDVDWEEAKNAIEERLKSLKDEIKRSEIARNFFNDMLNLTGDENVAATMTMTVYGETGNDLERKLREQLAQAFELDEGKLEEQGLSVAQAHAEVARAIMENDYVALSDYLEYVTDKSKDTAKELLLDRMKTNADWLKDFQKTYSKSKTFQERIDIENAKRDQKLKEAREHNASQSELDAINQYYDEQVSSIELEALKDTYEWTQAFKDLERVSTSTLESLLHLLDEYIEKSKGKISPEALKAVTEARDRAQEQLVSRNAYSKSIDSLRRYALAKKKANELDKEGKKNTLEYKKAQDEASDALKDARDSITAINSSFETLGNIVSSVSDMLDLDELSDGKAVFEGIATGLGLVGTALVFINAMFELLNTNPIVLAISGVIAGVAALASIMSNLRVARANREIEKQSELIEDLEYQYSRLESAMAKTFGSDYITSYNQQLDNLLAKQEAYMKQAEAERSKGKKADQDKIKEYENSAREVGDQLTEMQTQLSEFFTDTDLTSAAKDFANAWIEAYKEFGSTTDAMKERFQDMIQNMVEKSLAAKIMQELLQPIFDQIDILAKEGGELSVEDISAIARMANTALPNINDAMGTLMNTLAAAGYNIRQHPGQFSGISRNIANATEESISGLAAGINTQNYYMQYMPIISANVATIVSYLAGGAVEVSGATPITPTNSELTMKYLSALPTMDENLALLLSLVRSMVVPRSASPNSAQNFLVAKVV